MGKLLAGFNILVTRPEGQADNLCRLLEEYGGKIMRFPVIEIQPIENLTDAMTILADLEQYDLGIFISSNAVDWTLKLVDKQRLSQLQMISIGAATTQHLMRGLSVHDKPIISNVGTNSLSLLELGILQADKIEGHKIIIFRGQGGNELLAEQLSKRGATVQYAEVYRRVCPVYDDDFIDRIWSPNKPDIIVATSNTGLVNLLHLMKQQQRALLLATQLVIMGERMLNCATTIGFRQQPVIAEESSDKGILNSIIQWSKSSACKRCLND